MAERKMTPAGERREHDERDERKIVGTVGASPPLSAQQSVSTTPVTVSGEQAGGTILLDTGQVVYTNTGAVPAVPGGPPDPTIIPGQFEAEAPPPEGGARMVDRGAAGPLTGDRAEEKK